MPTEDILDAEPYSPAPNVEADPEIPDTAFRDAIPKLPRGEELFTRGFAALAWLYGLYWIFWRWTSSLNTDALIFSIVLIVAETYGLINSFFLISTVWKLKYREPPPTPRGLHVDVFITNYDEPLEVLRRTAIGARAIKYPHRTFMLDDGKRDEVKAMAEALGIGYIRRENNENAKAGNLNHALKVTNGEFILQLDADHVPLPNILHRLLGYFEDPGVASSSRSFSRGRTGGTRLSFVAAAACCVERRSRKSAAFPPRR
jgi:cellulose synthase (UDP-forming)